MSLRPILRCFHSLDSLIILYFRSLLLQKMQKTKAVSFLYLSPTQTKLSFLCLKMFHKTLLLPICYCLLVNKWVSISASYSLMPLFDTLLACIQLHEVSIFFWSSFWTNILGILTLSHGIFFVIFCWKTSVKLHTETIHLECICGDKLTKSDTVW